MAKSISFSKTGGPEVLTLTDAAIAAPGANEIQVRNTAIGLNFIDIYKRRGLYPVSLPAVLGEEAAGEIEAVGDDISGFSPGDRVVYLGGDGAYAEMTNVPATNVLKLPAGVSNDVAAASFLKGLTVEMLVRQVFKLKAEHTALVHAAAGGVGTLLCQWANHIGARIIGVVGSAAKATRAQENGASDVMIRSATPDIPARVRELTGGRGVDVVYDSVGAATFEGSLDSLASRGHMVTFGNASGPVPPVAPLDLSRRGSLTLTRPTLFHYATPERLTTMADEVFHHLVNGALRPIISERFQLDKAADAHRRLESGETTGAIILKP